MIVFKDADIRTHLQQLPHTHEDWMMYVLGTSEQHDLFDYLAIKMYGAEDWSDDKLEVGHRSIMRFAIAVWVAIHQAWLYDAGLITMSRIRSDGTEWITDYKVLCYNPGQGGEITVTEHHEEYARELRAAFTVRT